MLCHSSVSGLVVHLQVGYTKMLKIVLNQSRYVQSSDNNFAKAVEYLCRMKSCGELEGV